MLETFGRLVATNHEEKDKRRRAADGAQRERDPGEATVALAASPIRLSQREAVNPDQYEHDEVEIEQERGCLRDVSSERQKAGGNTSGHRQHQATALRPLRLKRVRVPGTARPACERIDRLGYTKRARASVTLRAANSSTTRPGSVFSAASAASRKPY